MKLDQKGKVLAEYIWIDGSNGLRNKTKVSTFQSLRSCVRFSTIKQHCFDVANQPILEISTHTTQHFTAARQSGVSDVVDPTAKPLFATASHHIRGLSTPELSCSEAAPPMSQNLRQSRASRSRLIVSDHFTHPFNGAIDAAHRRFDTSKSK
jgi:hypothetical protein